MEPKSKKKTDIRQSGILSYCVGSLIECFFALSMVLIYIMTIAASDFLSETFLIRFRPPPLHILDFNFY